MCPLCNKNHVKWIQSIRVSDLVTLYKDSFGLNVQDEFKGIKQIDFNSCQDCDLKFFYPFVTGSEHFYKGLQDFTWYYLQEKSEYDFAAQYIKETDHVLEVGSGKGAFAKKIRTKHYTGLEYSQQASLTANQAGIKVINETIENHARNHQEFYDVVCFFQVLEHVSNIRQFLECAIACLKNGGLLIISVPSADSFLSNVRNGILNMPPHHISWWTDKALQSIASISGTGLVQLEHERLSDIHLPWYCHTIALNALNHLLGTSTKMIDMTFASKVRSKIASVIGNFYCKGLNNIYVRPRGHSVTVIYQKSKS